MIGCVVAILTYYEARRVAELSISAIDIARDQSVPMSSQNAGKSQPDGVLQTPVIDVTVRNAGVISGLVSEIRLTVEYAELLTGCWGGGGLNYTAFYPIEMPQDNRPTPYVISTAIDFEVEAGRHDQLAVVLGPRGSVNESSGPWLYVLQVELVDESGDALDGGSRVALFVPDLNENLMDAARDPTEWARPCLERNARVIDSAPLANTTVAADLQEYREALREVNIN